MTNVWVFAASAVLAAVIASAAMWVLAEAFGGPDDAPDEEPEETEEVFTLRVERDALRSRLAASERRSEEIIGNLESVIHRLRASRMTYGENNN